jgi:hypothetical protein
MSDINIDIIEENINIDIVEEQAINIDVTE